MSAVAPLGLESGVRGTAGGGGEEELGGRGTLYPECTTREERERKRETAEDRHDLSSRWSGF